MTAFWDCPLPTGNFHLSFPQVYLVLLMTKLHYHFAWQLLLYIPFLSEWDQHLPSHPSQKPHCHPRLLPLSHLVHQFPRPAASSLWSHLTQSLSAHKNFGSTVVFSLNTHSLTPLILLREPWFCSCQRACVQGRTGSLWSQRCESWYT